MACTVPPKTWESGFACPAETYSWGDKRNYITETGEQAHYRLPVHIDAPTSTIGNALGLTHLRTWPSLYDGTAHQRPEWFKPAEEVDVLICGAGPFGLELGMVLARQGVSFRILDKARTPCLSGRADAVHPRANEHLHSWGISHEATEEGPLINSTAIYSRGVKLSHNNYPISDSRYRGSSVITQGQLERIYIRDLLRHRVIVERETLVKQFQVQEVGAEATHPVRATLRNVATGKEETVRAQYLIGADGAASSIREQMKVPFDGLGTDIYWAIIDCQFKTDYPHLFGMSMITSEHGGCIVIPREDGFTRFYIQVNEETARRLHQARQARRNASSVGTMRVDDHGITPDEALEQLRKILAPWTVEFASPISWFSVWKVNERVARHFSSPDLRVHLGGDAAHVHSVLGAFGLNSSIYDAANLGWKLGLCIRKQALPSVILPTYDSERRLAANRVIRCSGAYLRFLCNSHLPLASLRGLHDELESHDERLPKIDGSVEADAQFMGTFYRQNSGFLMGLEFPIIESAITHPDPEKRPLAIRNGARAPSPRVCLDTDRTGYLYDRMTGVSRFHILIFCSDLQGPVREGLAVFSRRAFSPDSFFHQFGGKNRFNVVLVAKALPYQIAELLGPRNGQGDELKQLREHATVVYDDRAPDDDAHYWYGVNHARGAVAVVRPDLALGVSIWPDEVEKLEAYFAGFLVKQDVTVSEGENSKTSQVEFSSQGTNGTERSRAASGAVNRPKRSLRSWFASMLAL
ncbi:FAD binding domain-containing protein [Aspergillus foveolatus]|uniref:FAD binding domain-containing protein n=1 Tax=Aspergillus foveolatus TaxID=210207 RepID=UPI003CCD43F2